MNKGILKKQVAELLLNPFVLTEEEAKEQLQLMGVDINSVTNKLNAFERKLNGLSALLEGKKKKVEFQNEYEQFKENSEQNAHDLLNDEYKLAARKNSGTNEVDLKGEIQDALLLKRITKKNLE
ncbi:MAG: hypothetical protein Q8L04_14345 [Ignavibacteria bacterium]|nr:hypothetical protein [Ignavibacteria bacterium]